MESWGIFTFYNRRLLMPEGGGEHPPYTRAFRPRGYVRMFGGWFQG